MRTATLMVVIGSILGLFGNLIWIALDILMSVIGPNGCIYALMKYLSCGVNLFSNTAVLVFFVTLYRHIVQQERDGMR